MRNSSVALFLALLTAVVTTHRSHAATDVFQCFEGETQYSQAPFSASSGIFHYDIAVMDGTWRFAFYAPVAFEAFSYVRDDANQPWGFVERTTSTWGGGNYRWITSGMTINDGGELFLVQIVPISPPPDGSPAALSVQSYNCTSGGGSGGGSATPLVNCPVGQCNSVGGAFGTGSWGCTYSAPTCPGGMIICQLDGGDPRCP